MLFQPDRESVDRIKAAMVASVAASKRQDAVYAELRQALKQDLHKYRDAVWTSARLVAAYEFAADNSALDTFNAIWSYFEKAGGFRAARADVPVLVKARAP